MESPKYCLEAVDLWDKAKIKKDWHVKAFCAYGATEYGTDSAQIAKADAIIAEALRKTAAAIADAIAEALRKTAAAIAAAKFAAAMARLN